MNGDLLDTHLGLLDTDIPSKYFVGLNNVFKAPSRLVFKTSSIHVFKTFSRHVFQTSSRYVFNTSSTRLQRNSFSSSKTSWRHVLKTSGRPANVCWVYTSLFTANYLKNVWKKNFQFFFWSSLKIQTTISSPIWLLIQWFLCRSTAAYCP